jgi:hypothetical protein
MLQYHYHYFIFKSTFQNLPTPPGKVFQRILCSLYLSVEFDSEDALFFGFIIGNKIHLFALEDLREALLQRL